MTTVRELKLWLKQFDDDVEVEVLETEINYGYGGDYVVRRPLILKSYGNWEFFDATKNKQIKKTHPAFNRKILLFGED